MRRLLLMSLLASSLAGCAPSSPPVYAEPVRFEARAVPVGEALDLAAAGDDDRVVLDVRTPAEHAAGRIPGAVNIDVDAPDFQTRVAALDRAKTWLVHCSANVPNGRSARAMRTMNQLGFDAVENLVGGYNAWVEAGGGVVSGD